ncbi:hypothetical protein DICA2_E16710 [Diutina catenulata]
MPEFVKSGEAPDEEPRDVFEDDEERVTLYDQLEAFKERREQEYREKVGEISSTYTLDDKTLQHLQEKARVKKDQAERDAEYVKARLEQKRAASATDAKVAKTIKKKAPTKLAPLAKPTEVTKKETSADSKTDSKTECTPADAPVDSTPTDNIPAGSSTVPSGSTDPPVLVGYSSSDDE